jgi:hypothetical protein
MGGSTVFTSGTATVDGMGDFHLLASLQTKLLRRGLFLRSRSKTVLDMQGSPAHVSDVSVGKISNLKPFQKGTSGNPGGKPKGEDVRAMARKNTKKAFERILELIDSDDERVAFAAAKEVIDRAYGKAKPMDDEDAADKKALTINIVRYEGAIETYGKHQPPAQLDATTVSVRTLEAP